MIPSAMKSKNPYTGRRGRTARLAAMAASIPRWIPRDAFGASLMAKIVSAREPSLVLPTVDKSIWIFSLFCTSVLKKSISFSLFSTSS